MVGRLRRRGAARRGASRTRVSQCRTRASALRRQGSDSAQRQPLSGGTTLSNAAAASTWRSLVPHSAELSRAIRRAMFFGSMSGLRGQTGAAVPAASGAAIDRRTPPDRSGAVVAGGGHDDRTDEAAASVLVGVVSGVGEFVGRHHHDGRNGAAGKLGHALKKLRAAGAAQAHVDDLRTIVGWPGCCQGRRRTKSLRPAPTHCPPLRHRGPAAA